MMTTKTVTVTSFSTVETINTDSVLYKISFDDNTEAFMIGAPGEVEQYTDKLVDVEIRDDIYNGEVRPFIATIALRKVVNVITRRESLKLFQSLEDNSSNVNFRDINLGDIVNNAVVYCIKIEYGSSFKTDWIDLVVSDHCRYISRIRLFTPTHKEVDFAGSYIKCDIRRNNFGLNTQEVICCRGEYPPNPEVDIACAYITEVFKDNENMSKVLDGSNIIPFLTEYVGFERGSLLMQAAMEIDIAKELSNVSPAINVDDLMAAFIVDKFWALNANARYPKEFLNIHNALRFKSFIAPNTIDIVCAEPATQSPERGVYLNIKEMVKSLIRLRRGDVTFD